MRRRVRRKRWEELFAKSVSMRGVSVTIPKCVLEKVKVFLAAADGLSPPVLPQDLLNLSSLQKAMIEGAKIKGWLPVSRGLIHKYASWLGRWKSGVDRGELVVAIDKDIHKAAPGFFRRHLFPAASRRANCKFLAIVAHEIGHVLMGHANATCPCVRDMGQWCEADWADRESEAEAWLFAGFLRAFVFAEIGGARRRTDKTHEYV